MKKNKFFNILIFIIIVILFVWRISIFLFKSKDSISFVSCTEFYTENSNNKKLIDDINLTKKKRLQKLGLTCSSTDIIKIDIEKNTTIESSTIWAIYAEATKSKLRNYSISSFIDELYGNNLQDMEKNRVLEEIKGWLNDPQIPDNVRRQIEIGLQ
jgi:hypothetical protein